MLDTTNAAGRADEQRLGQLAVVELLFAVVGAAIIYARHASSAIVLHGPLPERAAIGIGLGAIAGALCGVALLRSPALPAVAEATRPLRPILSSTWSIVVVGWLAGLGEELLFRAALQPWIGLAWASVLFGLAHSGTARLHRGVSVAKLGYVMATVAAGVLLGMLYARFGLVASVGAHAAFDIVLLLVLAPAVLGAESRPPE